MFARKPSRDWPPQIDTACLRKTLRYMRDDLNRVPALRRAGGAIDAAIRELEAAERGDRPVIGSDGRVIPIGAIRPGRDVGR